MRSEMEKDILKVLVSEKELKARIQEMGDELYEKFKGKTPRFGEVADKTAMQSVVTEFLQ